ncbi:MBG domain-containing protein [Lactiplantibacillus dongliensis]|uniref:MBG domain-containing protein n=1 Tax=Lactiplantibacillus dongliensis TaxID=2559919 RepID=A0ABW1R2Z9_9LACO|nr:MBG domain-containing protein [Lactiplantibacillus dongliensis]
MKPRLISQEIKKHFILYKGHTGWCVKTRIFGGLVVTLSALTLAQAVQIQTASAATTGTVVTSTAPATQSTATSQQSTAPDRTAKSAAPASQTAPKNSAATPTTASTQSQATSSAGSIATSTTSQASSAATSGSSAVAPIQTSARAVSPRSLMQARSVRSAAVVQSAPTNKYPVLSTSQPTNIGVDTTQVNLTADQIADHFTDTVENRGGNDQDDDPTDNTVTQKIAADGSFPLTSNDPHKYYSSPGDSTSIQGHQSAHVSFEHEIDFSHNFSMSGALGIGSKDHGGGDSVGFIFAPCNPVEAAKGGSGGLLGLGGLSNAFGLVFDEYYNSNYNDPSDRPYVGWRTTDGSGDLQYPDKNDWKAASQAGLNDRSVNTLNNFTMNYNATTQMLTVVLGTATLTRKISDVSTGYSISVSASTGGNQNDYSAKVDKFSYTPKTIPLTVKLVDSADQDALLNDTDVTAVANIGDTISVFSTQAAADRAVADGEIKDPSLVTVLPTDSAGNIYVIDGTNATDNSGTVHYIGGTSNKAIADATYYTYTVTDADDQSLTVPVRLAFTAEVTPVDAATQQAIPGLDPVTVVAVAGEPVIVSIPGYTPTTVTLAAPVNGDKVAHDNLPIDQGTTQTDPTKTTSTTANPIGHYYTSTGKTVDGQTVTTKATVGTGQSITDDLNQQVLVDGSGQAVTSGGKVITNADYYWSTVGTAGATDSTDAQQPQTTGSILLPTAATLTYWDQQATENQAKADDYKAQTQKLYDDFIALSGLTQAQKDSAKTLLDSVVDIYNQVSATNGQAKAAFEDAEAQTDATTIYHDGQTGYARLEEVKNLLVSFKADLTEMTTTNQAATNSLATFNSWSQVYGSTPLQFPTVSLGKDFGAVTETQLQKLNNPDYYQYFDTDDPNGVAVTPKNVGAYIFKLTDAGRAYLKSLSTNSNAGLYVSAIVTITALDTAPSIANGTIVYGGDATGNWPDFIGNLDKDTDDTLSQTDFEVDDATGKEVTISDLQVNGTYTIRYTDAAQTALTKNKNYHFTTFGTAKLVVTPRPITVTAQDYAKTYGDPGEPVLDLTSDSIDGLVNKDSLASLGVQLVRATGEDAGKYPITLAPTATLNPNYQVTVTPGTFTISALPVTATLADATVDYGHTPTFVGDLGRADAAHQLDQADFEIVDQQTGKVVTADQLQAGGDYTIQYTAAAQAALTADGNYAFTFRTATLSVKKLAITVVAKDISKTYGDPDPVLTLTADSAKNLANQDKLSDLGVQLVRDTGEAVGDYAIMRDAKDTENPNYTITVTPGTFSIKPLATTTSLADASVVYGSDFPEFKGDFGAAKAAHPLSQSDFEVIETKTGDLMSAKQLQVGGDYTLRFTAAAQAALTQDKNYTEAAPFATAKLTVTPLAITVTAANSQKTYGDADPTLTLTAASAAGLVDGDTLKTLAVDLTRETGQNQGTYKITGTSANQNYTVTVNPGTFTITPRAITVTADQLTKTYGDPNPIYTAQLTDGTFGYNDQLSDLNLDLTRTNTSENVGTYTISGQADNRNYTVKVNEGSLKITPRAVTVKAIDNGKVYGATDPKLQLLIPTDSLVKGDSEADLAVTLTRLSGESVGTYAISGTSTSHNYAVTVTLGQFVIAAKALTVTVDNQTKQYGDQDAALTYTIAPDSLANGDDVAALNIKTNRDAGETVGRYTITGQSDDTNYAITFINGTMTINKRPVTVAVTNTGKTYGAADPELSLTKPTDVLVNGDTDANVLGVTLQRVAGEDVGSYKITGQATSANYDVTVTPGTFTIDQRAVTVAAADQTKTYGDADPTLTLVKPTSVLVNSDTDASVLEITLTRAPGENVGVYEITGTSKSKNYQVTVTPSKLTIVKRDVSVTVADSTTTYGTPAATLSLTADAQKVLVNGDTESALGVTLTRVAGDQAGDYTISGTSDSKNYTVKIGTGTLVILKKQVSVQANELTKTYGEADPTFTLADPSAVLVGHDTETDLGVTLTRQPGENVGKYEINGTATSANYIVAISTGYLTIKPAAAHVTVASAATTYGDLPSFTGTLSIPDMPSNLQQSDFQVVDAQQQIVPLNDLQAGGDYQIELTDLAQKKVAAAYPNYTFNRMLFGRLNVTRRLLTLRVDDADKYAGTADPQTVVQLTDGSLKSGETLSSLRLRYQRPTRQAVGTYPVQVAAMNPNYDVQVIPGELKILGHTVDADGNVTITEKDTDGNVVKVTKEWNDGHTTVYTNDPKTNTQTVSEIVDGQPVNPQTIAPFSTGTVLPDESGAATVVKVIDPQNPEITHYSADPDHDGVSSATELADGTDPLKADTDGDGVSDEAEIKAGTDPLKTDTDGDGVNDAEELKDGTNPLKADTDGDGVSDAEELKDGTNPLKADTDGDGVSDAEELKDGTNPLKADTDGDGVSDAEELKDGTNPLKADTDGDGVSDAEELKNGTNPLKADTDGDGLSDAEELKNGTNPLKADTDGDGVSDAEELKAGTNPLKADTDGDGLSDAEELKDGTNPLKADTDGDGVSDAEELKNGTNPLKADTDGDGVSDAEELKNGTNPLKADTDGDGLSDAEELKNSTNPLKADTDGDGLSDAEELKSGTNPLKTDTDGDGLSDAEELKNGTNPLKTDTDGDGLSDAEELKNGTNPLKADTDGDGVSDAEELKNGTNPLKADTDGDGLSDGEELKLHTNPLKADTDGDGLSDGEELKLHTNPLKADTDGDGLSDGEELKLHTNPLKADTDGDGLSDGEELKLHTNPLKADTDGDGLSDGEEVKLHTNPLEADTDGDGVNDGTEFKRQTNPLKADQPADDKESTTGVHQSTTLMPRQAKHSADQKAVILPQTNEQSSNWLAVLGMMLLTWLVWPFNRRHQ